jgi:capsular polysaccharide export protein
VANDLSVRLGGAGVGDNGALLAKVREANPEAFIVYKPHPDVDAGHRPGALADDDVLQLADVVVRDASMASLIDAVDEVHTMTSLAGFEALLRGKRVVAWGQPFYAGWGLTEDKAPIARRVRSLSLEQLAAGVLILYPRYMDPVTGMPCPVEVLMDRLAEPQHWRPGALARLRRLEGVAHRRCKAVLRAGRRMMTIRRQA